ncbi:MAG: hypothetical protein MUC99_05545 [Anaerolineae bacterium]|jgi:hypothetical protein|nr:hypothetical protein [Anaerolineae bacterium]
MMDITATVQILVKLSEQEYRIIQHLRLMPETQRISTENAIFSIPVLPAGIDSRELLAFLAEWRQQITPEDIASMRESFNELRQLEEGDDDRPSSF